METVPIFHKNFFNFRSDTTEKHDNINLCSYGSKSYSFVVLHNSEVTFAPGDNEAFFCLVLVISVASIDVKNIHQRIIGWSDR